MATKNYNADVVKALPKDKAITGIGEIARIAQLLCANDAITPQVVSETLKAKSNVVLTPSGRIKGAKLVTVTVGTIETLFSSYRKPVTSTRTSRGIVGRVPINTTDAELLELCKAVQTAFPQITFLGTAEQMHEMDLAVSLAAQIGANVLADIADLLA
jgi:hypothetical protein